MIELEQGQETDILRSKNIWYTCVFDKNGLISYSVNPYITEGEQGIKIDIQEYLKAFDKIKEFKLEKEVNFLKTPDDYNELVRKVINLQDSLFVMSATEKLIKSFPIEEKLKQAFTSVCQGAESLVVANEELFKLVAKQVPKNWAYAMFPESSWTAYPAFVEEHRIALGNMRREASKFGTTREEVNKQINLHKDYSDEILIDLDEQIKSKYKLSENCN